MNRLSALAAHALRGTGEHAATDAARPALAFEGVGVKYPDGTVALGEVSLSVPRGQFCVLLGPSGAGKSTLLRTVNGLVAPSAGRVRIHGAVLDTRRPGRVRREIGMVHQQFNLIERATVATNVLAGALPCTPFWRAMAGWFSAAQRRRACELVEAVGLGEEHLLRRAGELSGGQQQRVGVARAFILDPSIVLADEPVASLDPRTSREILELLKRQSRERGATVLCTLHQVDLAREFADRIVALRDGQVRFDGAPGEFDAAAAASLYGHPPQPVRPVLELAGEGQ
jgi:phosphonate transport system ATP-binding protein